MSEGAAVNRRWWGAGYLLAPCFYTPAQVGYTENLKKPQIKNQILHIAGT